MIGSGDRQRGRVAERDISSGLAAFLDKRHDEPIRLLGVGFQEMTDTDKDSFHLFFAALTEGCELSWR